jgi:uncharacterized paraquat-inducible protein A
MRTFLAAGAAPPTGGAAGMQSLILLILIVLIIVISIRAYNKRRDRNSILFNESNVDSKQQQNGLKCPKCKQAVRSADKFCQSCGHKL